MSITNKAFSELTADTLTAAIAVDCFTSLDKAYGRTTQVCTLIWELYDTDNDAGERLVIETAKLFGVGGEGTPAYRRHSSFKSVLNRMGSKLETPQVMRWKRDSDANITDCKVIAAEVKTDKPAANGGENGTPQHVEGTPPPVTKFKKVADIVKAVMDGKPKRTKVSTIIIGLMDHIGKGGIAEVMAECQKRMDAEAAPVETEAETKQAA